MIPNVISLKKGRLRLFNAGESLFLCKKTTKQEKDNFLVAAAVLPSKPVIQSPFGLLSVSTPEFIFWDDTSKEIVMSFEEGLNLEMVLRDADRSDRTAWVDFVGHLFSWIKSTGFLWDDCSPRNIILNVKEGRIIFVDFERGLQDHLTPISDQEFAAYLRTTPLEEFCAFLFKRERGIFSEAWSYEAGTLIDLGNIRSERRRLLLNKTFGHREGLIPVEDLVFVDRMMVDAVTPFRWRGKAFFPLTYLDKAAGDGEGGKYVEFISRYLAFTNLKSKVWFLENLR